MELTTKQIQEIDTYISSCGVKFYDVRAEIVDHFATVLEQRLEENPVIDFKKEIVKTHRNFSNKGFSKLLETKTKAVHKKFYISSLKHLLSFFKLPKIIISIAIFLGLNQIMNLINDKELFFSCLSGLAMLIVIISFVKEFLKRKKKRESFLTLNKNDSFLQLINFLAILFNSSINFRSKISFEHDLYNQIHLGCFVLFILFYWSGENVYYQNKKMVLKQYPNVKI